jgi:hypothetical protein
MRVLVACEFSGVVRRAFLDRGHDAWSCDLLPAEDGSNRHYQCDVLELLGGGFDMMIAHPPCTYLTCAAEWAYGDGPYHQRVKPETLVGAARRAARVEAIAFVEALLNCPIPRVCVENPVGVLSKAIGRPAQTVQPWMFGDDASKATCLWLKGLPPLYATDTLPGGRSARRANQTASGQNRLSPSPDRWKLRSVTYPGIASAMADQWGVA